MTNNEPPLFFYLSQHIIAFFYNITFACFHSRPIILFFTLVINRFNSSMPQLSYLCIRILLLISHLTPLSLCHYQISNIFCFHFPRYVSPTTLGNFNLFSVLFTFVSTFSLPFSYKLLMRQPQSIPLLSYTQ